MILLTMKRFRRYCIDLQNGPDISSIFLKINVKHLLLRNIDAGSLRNKSFSIKLILNEVIHLDTFRIFT